MIRIQAKAPPRKNSAPSQAASELDPAAMSAIRDMIRTEAQPAPETSGQASLRQAQQVARQHTAPRAAAVRPEAPATAPRSASAPQEVAPGLKARIKGYRPTPRHIALAAFALLVVFRPWLVVGLALLGVFAFVCVLLILGYDGFWQRAMSLARWYASRRPERAAELHRKLDNFAVKWDALLDRFPEGTVDALYLPDFGELAAAEERHDRAMERRLSGLNGHDL